MFSFLDLDIKNTIFTFPQPYPLKTPSFKRSAVTTSWNKARVQCFLRCSAEPRGHQNTLCVFKKDLFPSKSESLGAGPKMCTFNNLFGDHNSITIHFKAYLSPIILGYLTQKLTKFGISR